MTEAFTVLCVFLVGAATGVAISAVTAWMLTKNVDVLLSIFTGSLRQASAQTGCSTITTVDVEQRLVVLPVDRLLLSIETQVPLWSQNIVAAASPPHIRFDPPEGSS